ncbi:lycopene cyclase family protein [Arcicella sp. LKC2W]|uniref:lycopene cyclase family protein n=1 Tax=Arcicella sp. LKC2W TaxID=2984198 RepID=UPI002B21A626|nr:lycopene cyclase family protein [Arcicella sp. LKC2W]MEA5460759.1 lycopene cyclase family protein [Arcicella sp. LKC2W]
MSFKNNQNLQNTYDYIIAGGGMAGLSLAFYLNQSSLRNKSILIIDRDVKNTNDHTWCFWEKGQSPYEEIIAQKWKGVWFYGTNNFSQFLDIQEYTYKMIRGIDFYNYVIPVLKQNVNITFLQADILAVSETVKTNKGDFYASDLVFDSSFRSKYNNPDYHNMLQHFKGWVIETTKPVFKVNEPTLFDFRTEQKNELRFVYVLPHSETKALIEFTIFSDNLIEDLEYEFYLKKYIEETVKVGEYQIKPEEYQISETEFGIVPMSDEPHEVSPMPKVIRIGTSGGYVKASTGYSFQRSQRFLQRLVKSLEQNIDIKNGMITNHWKGFLDTVLLNVMLKNRTPQDEIFTRLFKYNKPSQVLKFLDEDTSFFEDVALINTVPKPPFIKAAWNVLFKKLF